MGRDCLRLFDRAAILKVSGNAGRAERMATGPSRQADASRPTADHVPHVTAVHALFGKPASSTGGRTEQRRLLFTGGPGGQQVGVEIFFGNVMRRNLVVLAAFFMQPQPAAFAVLPVILDIHPDHGAHAGEGVNHHTDEGAIPHADQRAGID